LEGQERDSIGTRISVYLNSFHKIDILKFSDTGFFEGSQVRSITPAGIDPPPGLSTTGELGVDELGEVASCLLLVSSNSNCLGLGLALFRTDLQVEWPD
jgi:hypothetical protein